MRLRIVFALGLALSVLWTLRDGAPRLSSAATSPPAVLERGPETLLDIPYAKTASGEDARRQTLDLYLPRRTPGSNPPLLIFLHGGFWMSPEDDPTASSPAEALQVHGVAVALVRYRLAPRDRHPAQARDAAAAVAHLVQEAARYGFDRRRIFLAGHASGAHLAALVALDPSYLAAHRLDPRFLAGVIAISGIYDLAPQREISESQKYVTEQAFGADPAQLKAASPFTHVRAKAPPFLILTAAGDFPDFHIDARKFADALRAEGNTKVDEFVVPDQDHRSIVQWTAANNLAYGLVLEFLNVQPLSSELAALFEAKRKWIRPPFSTLPFWRHKSLIRSYPFDQRFAQMLAFVYPLLGLELQGWPLQKYHAVDLFSYLDALPKGQAGRGDYLVTTNVRNEKQFWARRQIEPYQPVIVIGIDDEKNLFRFSVFYRMQRQYSWKPGAESPVLARPLGAFIYFLKEPPAELQAQSWHYSLTPESFRLVDKDPLGPIRDVSKEVQEVLTYRNGCVYCHSFRDIGTRSHHNAAATGDMHGGLALPLESYPPEVWKAFLFDQYEVAEKIGANPNVVDTNVRQELHDLVAESRKQRQTPTK